MESTINLDINLLDGSITSQEKEVLIEYQNLARTLQAIRQTLEQMNSNVNVIAGSVDDNVSKENLSDTLQELEREMSILNGAFKNAVHKVLLNEDMDIVDTSK